MLFNSSKTGNTDLRETDVQQPNTTDTLSLLMSSRAFSANNGQLEAGSTTTASNFLPNKPPFLFCSSTNINTASFNVVSEIAIVPDKECSTPILMVSLDTLLFAADCGATGVAIFCSTFGLQPNINAAEHKAADNKNCLLFISTPLFN